VKREKAIAIYQAGQEPVVKKLCELSAKVDEQAKKIASLQKNSSNSSKPPSSDITKPPKIKKGKGKKNKRGGQPSHPKHERAPFSEMRSMSIGNIIVRPALNATAATSF
jgi:transposase